jgi:protein gp37
LALSVERIRPPSWPNGQSEILSRRPVSRVELPRPPLRHLLASLATPRLQVPSVSTCGGGFPRGKTLKDEAVEVIGTTDDELSDTGIRLPHMSQKSAIEWTEATWNPVTGCDRVSVGCDHCYALTLARRLKAMGNPRYQNDGRSRTSGPGFGVTLHPDKLNEPLRWKRPRTVFVNSMSDLFHPDVPSEFVASVFAVMEAAHWHQFQVLTKRPRRMAHLLNDSSWRELVNEGADRSLRHPREWPLPNVWLGTSIENQAWADQRVPLLLRAPAMVRFLSCEPLLGPIDLRAHLPLSLLGDHRHTDADGSLLHWVIVGGESGPGARQMELEWAIEIRDVCLQAGVPFFFKQWGGRTPKAGGRSLDGRTWDELPTT